MSEEKKDKIMFKDLKNYDEKQLEDTFIIAIDKYFNLHDDERAITIKKQIDIKKENLNKKFNINNNLAQLIKESGLTQTEIAETIGITRATLNNILNNKFSTSLEVALKLSKLFKTPVNHIFFLEEPKEK